MKRRDFAIGFGATLVASPLIGRAAGWTLTAGRGDFSAAAKGWDLAASGAVPALGRTDALVVLQDGRLVFERYGLDHGPTTRHVSWSMAKSFTHALVGIGVAQGRVDLDRPLKSVIHADAKLSLRALLTLTDGLDWDEGSYAPTDSDATKMLYGPGRFDGAAYVAAKRQVRAPGTKFNYSTGAFQLAAAELALALFPQAASAEARRTGMAQWIAGNLFRPLGMSTALAEFDAAGTFMGGSLVYACALDFARFGELYRLDGVWAGHRILPAGWVKFARTPTVEPTYGAGFWLETKAGANPPSLMNGAGPADTFSAQGHEGQVIAVVPSKGLVVVRLGLMQDDNDRSWQALGAWLAPMITALPDG